MSNRQRGSRELKPSSSEASDITYTQHHQYQKADPCAFLNCSMEAASSSLLPQRHVYHLPGISKQADIKHSAMS